MGASNSKPQTTQLVNSAPVQLPIEMTPSVIKRLQQEIQEQNSNSKNTTPKPTQAPAMPLPLPVPVPNAPLAMPVSVPVPVPIIAPLPPTPGIASSVSEASTTSSETKLSTKLSNDQLQKKTIESEKPQIKVIPNRSVEAEENQYKKTLQQLEIMMGKPVYWSERYGEEMTSLKGKLLNCYKDHPNEPLACAPFSKEYQEFIFAKQLHTVLNPEKKT